MSGLSDDNKVSKRQRTYEIKDDRIVVNVGGKLFPTFRSTLTMKSTYFEKRLSGRFSDDAGDSEIIVDRDHEPFSIILSYLRSGELLISPDKLLFSSILIEADFYGIDELLDMVRDQCYCNLNHINCEEELCDLLRNDRKIVFPTYKHIIKHVFFPSMYFNKDNYYRVISTHVLPENKHVRLERPNGTVEYKEVWQSVTYQCLQSSAIFVEPLISLAELAPYWLSVKDPTDWREENDLSYIGQLVPVRFYIGFYGSTYLDCWHTVTKTVYKPSHGSIQYTVRSDGAPFTKSPDLAIIYKLTNSDLLTETKLYGYSCNGDEYHRVLELYAHGA